MGVVTTGFYQELLRAVGAPVTRENLRALLAWQRAEGGRATYNPFNTTQPAAGATWYNTFGPNGEFHVRNYPDAETGRHATATTLLNGRYPGILKALRAGNNGVAVAAAIDASPWGTHSAEREYRLLYGSAVPQRVTRRVLRVVPPPGRLMHGSDVRQLQEALAHKGFSPIEIDGLYGRNTERAVKGFQRAHHLDVDGVVGPHTWHALGFA